MFFLLLTLLSAQALQAQSPNDNWIKCTRYTDTAGSDATVDVVFYNGLGLECQTISVAATLEGHSLVTPVAYDCALRPANRYLPYALKVSTGYRQSDAVASQSRYYLEKYGDATAFTTDVYEAAPTNRIVGQYAAGGIVRKAEKLTAIEYTGNIDRTVFRMSVSPDGELTVSGYYYPNDLSVQKTVDADGCTREVFSDKLGNPVLERSRPDSDSVADTYFVYDDGFCLRYVLPPSASRQLTSPSTYAPTSDFCRNFCYAYRYDARRRVVERQFPGSEAEYLVYDHEDRIVGRQSGYDRSHGCWMTMRYTPTGLLKGVSRFNSDITRETFQKNFARYASSGAVVQNYEYGVYPNIFSELKFEEVPGVVQTSDKSDAVQGLKTWECFYSAASDDGYYCVMRQYYYDYLGRVIQCAERHSDGRVLRTSYRYDFTGNALIVVEQSDEITKRTEWEYDLRGRLLRENTLLNGQSVAEVTWNYDDLGRVSGRNYPKAALEESIGYNLQGFQTTQTSPLFSMELRYHNPIHAATRPSYTGNVSEWTFRQGTAEAENTYGFSYDGLSRLTDTKQYVDGIPSDLYVEKGFSYDLNGNILTLQRTADGSVSDSLAYTYTGDRLTALSGTTSCTYAYDSVGNLVHDGAHDLDITYNGLNLIEKVTRNGSILAKYSYLSDSTKLSATNASGNGLCYLGSFVYEKRKDSLSFESTGFSAGRIVAVQTEEGTVYTPLYFITDHLGSVRVVVDGDGHVMERNDYYPFGLRWPDANSLLAGNRYRYNGKEEQAFAEVPYIDYGARMYDPKFRLRWNGADPLSEKFYPASSYAFCADDPLSRVDVDGRISAQQ